MKNLGATVICCDCGKTLRGVAGLGPGWHVRKHKNDATGRPCRGYLSTRHELKRAETRP